MEFKRFKSMIQEHFLEITKNVNYLFEVELDKDQLWNLYLDSFPAGTNEIFRERRQYDCSSCRQFIKNFGNVVVLENGVVKTIWDIDTDCSTFKPVAEALSSFVKKHSISDFYISDFNKIGIDINYERTITNTYAWSHLHLTLPNKFVNHINKSIESIKGEFRDIKNVFKRSLDELKEENVLTVLELISQNSLYRGEEWKQILKEFLKYKKEYDKLKSNDKKDLYAWENSQKAGIVVAKLRNHSIGTLLINISEGMNLDLAVKKYEDIVAGPNYKRPKPIYTEKMLNDAKNTIIELGYMESLNRRFANIDDITVNNILFSNKDSAKRMATDIFDEMKSNALVNPKKFSKCEEISINDFINNVLPIANELEVYLENSHVKNMVSLIAPQNKESKTMFKWNNNFSWAYTGNIADSLLKQNVKKVGGNVDGVLRFSIQWNDTDITETCDLDAHCIEPNGYEIYFGNKRKLSPTHGMLDVDIIHPSKNTAAVENITWTDLNKMENGEYLFFIKIYSGSLRGTVKAEIEFNDQIFTFESNASNFKGDYLNIAKVKLSNGEFTIVPLIDANSSINSKDVWGLKTNQFIPVSIVMNSPNYWDEQDGIGNKHYFFMLKNCVNDENPNGFYNEFLKNELLQHKRVFEALGSKMNVNDTEDQLSGLGFSSTQRNTLIVKVKGNVERILKVKF